jgi:hypothetical protein
MSEQLELLETLKKLRKYYIDKCFRYDPNLDKEIKRLEDLTYMPMMEE